MNVMEVKSTFENCPQITQPLWREIYSDVIASYASSTCYRP